MANLISLKDFINSNDIKNFNKALMKMMIKLQEENDYLKEKLKHLESIMINSDILNLGD